MTSVPDSTGTPAPADVSRGNLHFGVACALMAGVAVLWVLGPSPVKSPVPWPASVAVDKGFRLTSLAPSFGDRYELVLPQGDQTLAPTDMEALGIGTGYDESRYGDRASNWYCMRVYRDKANGVGWRLRLTYYTGAMDTVPHIPETCLAANGATILESRTVTLAPGGLAAPWDGPLKVRRTSYEQGGRTFVQYYLFSLNGEPEDDWRTVRGRLGLPWVKHCYFAKIEFGPDAAVFDPEAFNKEAQTFLAAAMPEVLRQLPMPSDIERLKAR